RVYIHEGDVKTIPPGDVNTFITKSGKVIRKRFSISGGSVGLFEGKKIGRARNLEKLEKEIKTLSTKLEEIKQSLLDRQRDLEKLRNNGLRNQIEELQNTIRQITEEHVSVRTKREQFASMLSNADLRREDMLEKIDVLTRELDELRPNAQTAQRELAEQENKLSAMADDLAAHTELLSHKSAVFNEQNIFFHQQENRVKSIDQEIRFKQESMDQSGQRIQNNSDELQRNEQEIADISESTQTNDDELLAMYSEKEDMEKGSSEAEKEYYEWRANIDAIEKELREVQHGRQN